MYKKYLTTFLLFCFTVSCSCGSEPVALSPEDEFKDMAFDVLHKTLNRPDRMTNVTILGPHTPGYTGHFRITCDKNGLVLRTLPKAEPFCGGGLNYADVVNALTQDPEARFDTFNGECQFKPRVVTIADETFFVRQHEHPFKSNFGLIQGSEETFALLVTAKDMEWNHTLSTIPLLCLHCPKVVGLTSDQDEYSEGQSLCFLAIQPADRKPTSDEEHIGICLLHGHVNFEDTDLRVFNAQRIAVFTLEPKTQQPSQSQKIQMHY